MILLPSFADSPVHRVLERAQERRTRSRGRRLLSPGHECRAKLNRRICERVSIPIAADISLFCVSARVFARVVCVFLVLFQRQWWRMLCNKRSGTSATIKERINKTIISINFLPFPSFSRRLNLFVAYMLIFKGYVSFASRANSQIDLFWTTVIKQ